MTHQDLEDRLERVETQHADTIRVCSSHTAAMAGHTAALATLSGHVMAMQQVLGTVVAELAVVPHQVPDTASRLERLEAFLRSKLNGGERQ